MTRLRFALSLGGALALGPGAAVLLPAIAPAQETGEGERDSDSAVAATVGMGDLRYDPERVTITVGETIEWRNSSQVVHTVTADPEKAALDDSVRLPEGAEPFGSGDLEPGDTFRRTFETPGRYTYFCIPHERADMIGEIVVEAAPEGSGPKQADAAEAAEEAGAASADGEESRSAEQDDAEGAATEQAASESAEDGTEQDGAAEDETRRTAVARGEYLVTAGGCESCHTADEGRFAGGARLETPFGVFHPPNLTPDPETGLGRWSEDDFVTAMKQGVSPQGHPYYPVFPYAWFTRIYAFDLRDIWAYLQTVGPVENATPPHALRFPFGEREFVHGWRALDFERGPAPADPARSASWNRGSYLVNALAHCGACHTTKTAFGTWRDEMHLAGSTGIPGAVTVAPNITPDEETGIGSWTKGEIVELLRTGVDPDGNFLRGEMAKVIAETTSRLDAADREAIADYLLSIPPVSHRPGEGDAPERRAEAGDE
ncbi:plastocyanin/azurin family copper-binding protein [Salinarimonas sp.]|uniref:plastocyanin/azurin family copper-binding protein n=1 Tax=Salinarimonas sp. TaxID=2766526 RepID=UPI0032D98FE9